MTGGRVAVAFSLLGGLSDGGELRTASRFRRMSGYVEERLHTIATAAASLPARVTDVIAATVATIGRDRASRPLCRDLCIADRRLVMLKLAQRLGGDTFWISPVCRSCDTKFDVRLRRSEMPMKTAGSTFPLVDVRVRGVDVRLRVPTGGDQEAIAHLDDAAAAAELFRRCVVRVGDDRSVAEFVDACSGEDISAIEDAVDAVAPDVGTTIRVACPECALEQLVSIDPYQFGLLEGDALFREVHTLAVNYHWNERDILSLSRRRRHRYLQLIDSAQGKHG